MHLVQILLPLYDNDGAQLPRGLHARVREELAETFGGVTAFSRAPAEGLWKGEGETRRDDIIVFAVMAETLDTSWWRSYRHQLEERFRQEMIVIRAQAMDLL